MQERHALERDIEAIVSDHSISEMIALASRLREQSGGELDDAAIDAVAEATGAPSEYVRIALRSANATQTSPRRKSLLERIREQILTVDARLRNSVFVASMGIGSGVLWKLAGLIGSGSQLLYSLAAILVVVGMSVAIKSKDQRSAGALGAIWGGAHYLSFQLIASLVAWLTPLRAGEMPWIMLGVMALVGFLTGAIGQVVGRSMRGRLGWRDAQEERQALVTQLVEIQDRLRQQEKFAAFLSLDIVGSTRMKADNDPISIEYTFTEYHNYIEAIAAKHGGQLHSTAGDGVICVFEEASHAYDAGRAILGGLFEFNSFRNRTKDPIQLRAGLHYGTVGAAGMDASMVNFAHVIDMAAHLQKEAPIGAMLVSEAAAADLPGGLASVGTERVLVDGVQAASWRPKTSGIPVGPRPERN